MEAHRTPIGEEAQPKDNKRTKPPAPNLYLLRNLCLVLSLCGLCLSAHCIKTSFFVKLNPGDLFN